VSASERDNLGHFVGGAVLARRSACVGVLGSSFHKDVSSISSRGTTISLYKGFTRPVQVYTQYDLDILELGMGFDETSTGRYCCFFAAMRLLIDKLHAQNVSSHRSKISRCE